MFDPSSTVEVKATLVPGMCQAYLCRALGELLVAFQSCSCGRMDEGGLHFPRDSAVGRVVSTCPGKRNPQLSSWRYRH